MLYTGPMRNIRLDVTAEDILTSNRVMSRGKGIALCDVCPVALALLRQTGDTYQVYGTFARRLDDLAEFKLPLEVHHWILNLDSGVKVAPKSFDIKIPAKDEA